MHMTLRRGSNGIRRIVSRVSDYVGASIREKVKYLVSENDEANHDKEEKHSLS